MIYVISDLHGYPHEKFLQLLKSAGFCDDDFLYILGDVIDRNGDGGIKTLCWLLEQPNVQLILGNHEAMLLSCEFLFSEITDANIEGLTADKLEFYNTYCLNGGTATLGSLRKLPKDTQADIFDYLRDTPVYDAITVNSRDYLLVHAGLKNFSPDKKIPDYTPDELLWESPEFGDEYYPDIVTVFGHTPTFSYGEEFRGKIIRTNTWTAIDTGAAYGEKPVLLRLDDGSEFTL